MADPQSQTPPRVFISYSHQPTEDRERVVELARALRVTGGVDAWIDRYTNAPAEGWREWMEGQLRESQFVLLVCTPTYLKKWTGPSGGVGYEVTFVRNDLNLANNTKYIPLLLDDDSESIPTILRAYPYYRYPADFEQLLRHLWNEPEVVAPDIGARPMFPPREPLEIRSEGAPDAPAPSATTRPVPQRVKTPARRLAALVNAWPEAVVAAILAVSLWVGGVPRLGVAEAPPAIALPPPVDTPTDPPTDKPSGPPVKPADPAAEAKDGGNERTPPVVNARGSGVQMTSKDPLAGGVAPPYEVELTFELLWEGPSPGDSPQIALPAALTSSVGKNCRRSAPRGVSGLGRLEVAIDIVCSGQVPRPGAGVVRFSLPSDSSGRVYIGETEVASGTVGYAYHPLRFIEPGQSKEIGLKW